jgi:CRP-like cAMP-binding protein
MTNYKQNAEYSSIFNGLKKQEKDDLLKDGKIRHLNKKEFLFYHGDSLACFYIVCSGIIQIFRTNSDGDEKTLHILIPKDTICGDEIFDSHTTHQFSAVAVENSTVIEFPKKWLEENTKKYGNIALNLLASIAHRSQMAEIEAEHKATMSTAQLIACFLQKLCLVYNLNPHGFTLPYSKKLIASRLGIEVETFSRALLKLQKYGISVKGSRVTIGNFNTIEKNVCDHCSIEQDCKLRASFKKKFN